MTAEQIQAIFEKHKLPASPGPALDARWIAQSGDWWVKTEKGWFWLDERKGFDGVWMLAPNGPP
jgi:hypothetical protein